MRRFDIQLAGADESPINTAKAGERIGESPFEHKLNGLFYCGMQEGIMSGRGFTTAILHSDRSKPIEHGSLHKPIHNSVAFGYADARDLARGIRQSEGHCDRKGEWSA